MPRRRRPSDAALRKAPAHRGLDRVAIDFYPADFAFGDQQNV